MNLKTHLPALRCTFQATCPHLQLLPGPWLSQRLPLRSHILLRGRVQFCTQTGIFRHALFWRAADIPLHHCLSGACIFLIMFQAEWSHPLRR